MAQPSKLERFHSSDIGRVGAFSDCVFSIAMTLLMSTRFVGRKKWGSIHAPFKS